MSGELRGTLIMAVVVLWVASVWTTWLADGPAVAGRIFLTGLISAVAIAAIGYLTDGGEAS